MGRNNLFARQWTETGQIGLQPLPDSTKMLHFRVKNVTVSLSPLCHLNLLKTAAASKASNEIILKNLQTRPNAAGVARYLRVIHISRFTSARFLV